MGAKAGASSGLIYGIIRIILGVQGLLNSVKWEAGANVDRVNGLLWLIPFVYLVFLVVGGAVIGLVFVKVRKKLPGKTITMKAFILALVIWIIGALGVFLNGSSLSPGSGLFGIGQSVLVALMFGYLFNWFAKKETGNSSSPEDLRRKLMPQST